MSTTSPKPDLARPAEPEEVLLLRRFAALPRHSDQLAFLAAALNVASGQTPESAYRGVRRRARSLAAMAGWATRRRAEATS